MIDYHMILAKKVHLIDALKVFYLTLNFQLNFLSSSIFIITKLGTIRQ